MVHEVIVILFPYSLNGGLGATQNDVSNPYHLLISSAFHGTGVGRWYDSALTEGQSHRGSLLELKWQNPNAVWPVFHMESCSEKPSASKFLKPNAVRQNSKVWTKIPDCLSRSRYHWQALHWQLILMFIQSQETHVRSSPPISWPCSSPLSIGKRFPSQ